MTLRVLIVDDEQMARRRLGRLVSSRPGVEVVGYGQDGSEVGPRVAEGDVDLVLLDIDMPDVSGLEAKGLLGHDGPLVVFVTAHAEHALAAFDVGALDYVLKPVDPERLGRALDRAVDRLEARRAHSAPSPAVGGFDEAPSHREKADGELASSGTRGSPGPDLERLALSTRRGTELLRLDEIRYALVDGESVMVHSERGTFVTELRMVALEGRLPADRFLRTHRRALVNLAHIVRLEPVGAGVYVAELSDGASVPVSRMAAKRLKDLWRV